MLEHILSKPMTDYKRTLLETFSITYEALYESTQQLLSLCSYMAPNNIPLSFFERQRKHLPLSLYMYLEDTYKTDEIIAELINYSLAKRDKDFLIIHQLVQEIVRERLDSDNVYWLEICIAAAIDEIPHQANINPLQQLSRNQQNAAHIIAIIGYSEDVFVDNEQIEKKHMILQYCLNFGKYRRSNFPIDNIHARSHFLVGDYNTALKMYKNDLLYIEKKFGKEHPYVASCYNNIGLNYSRDGKYNKALEWYHKALNSREKTLGRGHLDTATTYKNIAIVYDRQGNYSEALIWYIKCYRMYIYAFMGYIQHPYLLEVISEMETAYTKTDNLLPFYDWLEIQLAQLNI
jgi:tetratricopeptide (TPR) repeat protein